MRKFFVLVIVSLFMYVADASAQTAPKDSSTSKAWFSIADSASFTGKYKVEGQEFDNVTVVVKDTVLYFYAGSYEGPLDPLTKDSFLALGQVAINFLRDAENKIIGFKADAGNGLIEGKREKPAEVPKQK
ncbi:MAG TPA: hypothetical protein VK166_13360 [Chitinophagaceae bacterium]|nr:hypothetical protein [Chitinophagaceae bacterium]